MVETICINLVTYIILFFAAADRKVMDFVKSDTQSSWRRSGDRHREIKKEQVRDGKELDDDLSDVFWLCLSRRMWDSEK